MEASFVFPHQLFSSSPALSRNRKVFILRDPLFFKDRTYLADFHKSKLLLHFLSTNEYKDLVDRPRKVVMECTRIKDIWGIEQPDWRPRVPEYLGLKWPEGNLEK